MTDLAHSLANYAVDRPVLDSTGYSRSFAYLLVWSDPDAPQTSDSPPEIFTALREQVGLKLEPATAKVPVFVIDNIEIPTPN